jgi:hypothetical protein
MPLLKQGDIRVPMEGGITFGAAFVLQVLPDSGGALLDVADPLASVGSSFISSDDPRLTDAREPTAHASTHEAGGSDPLDLAAIAGSLPLPSRTTSTHTSASLATGASEAYTIAVAAGMRAIRVSSTRPAWLRVYASSAYRTSDAARLITADPTGDHGVLLEVVTTAAISSLLLSPASDMHSSDGSANLYASVVNQDVSTGTVGITLTYLRTE